MPVDTTLQSNVPLLELDLMRTLIAIAETGNMSAAGDVLGRTPSAISMQVKKMEDLVGRPLFLREARRVTLTRAGETVLEHARRVLALNRDIVGRFVTPDLAGEIRLGAPDDVAERFMPRMLRQFADEHPGITVRVVLDHSPRMIEMVNAGALDLTIITAGAGHAGDTLETEVIHREPLVWAGLSGGIAIEQDPLPLSQWEPHCLWRKAAIEALDAAGRPYRTVFESAHASGQRAAVLADLAVAQLPASMLADRIVEIPKRYGLPNLPDYALGLRVADDPSPVVLAACALLRRVFGRG